MKLKFMFHGRNLRNIEMYKLNSHSETPCVWKQIRKVSKYGYLEDELSFHHEPPIDTARSTTHRPDQGWRVYKLKRLL